MEFGSDFHRCVHSSGSSNHWLDSLGEVRAYSCGRQAMDALWQQEGWKRVWMPAYFCYEVIGHMLNQGIEIVFYEDNPLSFEDDTQVRSLPFQEGDVLFRMNYLGLRSKRSNEGIPVPVVEDHTHDLFSNWSLESDADWCIVSIRKSLPVAAGGILWSPAGHSLPEALPSTEECEEMARVRYEAMEQKADYLTHGGDKDAFRIKYLATEDQISSLSLSGMDAVSNQLAQTMDVKNWTRRRVENWHTLVQHLHPSFHILQPQDTASCQPFSLVILCQTPEERMALRSHLIQHCIYPAILWNVPEDTPFTRALDCSQRMLSIHCDARYSTEDIVLLCKLINSFYD